MFFNDTQYRRNRNTKRGGTTKKPKAVIEYNNIMGGVDKAVQFLEKLWNNKKRGKSYYFKILF